MDKIKGAQQQAQDAIAGAGQGQSAMPPGMGGTDTGPSPSGLMYAFADRIDPPPPPGISLLGLLTVGFPSSRDHGRRAGLTSRRCTRP